MPHPNNRIRVGSIAFVLALTVVAHTGCESSRHSAATMEELDSAVALLVRPLPGDFAALYDLRVARSGGLRLAVLTRAGDGRMTISEPFGGAVSLSAWTAGGSSMFFDMDQGCRREVDDLEEVLGVGALPLSQAVRLLGGRLPMLPGDDVVITDGSDLRVSGDTWAVRVRLAADPWRVVEVVEDRSDENPGWRLELDSHTSSVPGRIRVENPDGRWAELELKRLEWPDATVLPDLPDFPHCGGR